VTRQPDRESLPPLGILGTADRLTIEIGRPERNPLRHPPDVETTDLGPFTDLRQVSWRMVGDDGPGAADLAGESPAADRLPAGGLARLTNRRLIGGEPDRWPPPAPAADRGEILAPEVQSIGFRYFDGADWRDAWDSTARGHLPRALEVVLRFEPLRSRAVNPREDRPAVEQRTVIAVPLSEPYAVNRGP
jgi:hypothetical protein